MRRPDPLIVGGGPAGAAAAIVLAQGGARPLVLERSAEPHDALCGGFLSWSTARRLRELGVDPEALGAQPVDRVRLFTAAYSAEAALPARSWSLSRLTMDAALLVRAQQAGADVQRGVKVSRLDADGFVLGDSTRLEGGQIILATGKHDLRGVGRANPGRDPAIGLRWRLAGGERLRTLVAGTVELHLFGGGYAGLSIQEDGAANLCMAVKRSVLTQAGGDPAQLLARLCSASPALAARIDAARGDPGSVQSVANVPYGWIARIPAHGAFRVGDQGAVIPSLAGEGVAIALSSGISAARSILAEEDAARFQRGFAARAALPVQVAGAIVRAGTNETGARMMVRAVAAMPGLSALAARLSRISDGKAARGYSIPPG